MEKNELSVSEAAAVFDISVRTLHYYDEIGLVPPSRVSEAGYRFYGAQALSRLSSVLFYREIGLSLDEIARVLKMPETDRVGALKAHRELLELKRNRLDSLIQTVDGLLEGRIMKPKSYDEINEMKNRYADEVRSRWGDTEEYRQSVEKDKNALPAQQLDAAGQADEIFAAFASLRDADASDERVQALVVRWQKHITDNYYECSDAVLSCLGEMYVADERFTENLDRFGKGTAKLMCDAIRFKTGNQ